MNKRQIKKRVKRAKLKKENGRIMSLEDRHYMRNYGDRYYTKTEIKEINKFIFNWGEVTTAVDGVVGRIRNAFADVFQGFADSLRTGGNER